MKCGTRSCKLDALYRVHWPGQPICLCRACALRAAGIADAMSFTLTIEPIEPSTPILSVAVLIYDDEPKDPPS